MIDYALEHSDLLADFEEAGAVDVTFRRKVPGSAATTIVGKMLVPKSDPERFRMAGLIIGSGIIGTFRPATLGEMPEPGDTVLWGGRTYTVKSADPVAPDSRAIVGRIACEI